MRIILPTTPAKIGWLEILICAVYCLVSSGHLLSFDLNPESLWTSFFFFLLQCHVGSFDQKMFDHWPIFTPEYVAARGRRTDPSLSGCLRSTIRLARGFSSCRWTDGCFVTLREATSPWPLKASRSSLVCQPTPLKSCWSSHQWADHSSIHRAASYRNNVTCPTSSCSSAVPPSSRSCKPPRA